MYFATLQIKALLVIWEKSVFWSVFFFLVRSSNLCSSGMLNQSPTAEHLLWRNRNSCRRQTEKYSVNSASYITFLFSRAQLQHCVSLMSNRMFLRQRSLVIVDLCVWNKSVLISLSLIPLWPFGPLRVVLLRRVACRTWGPRRDLTDVDVI